MFARDPSRHRPNAVILERSEESRWGDLFEDDTGEICFTREGVFNQVSVSKADGYDFAAGKTCFMEDTLEVFVYILFFSESRYLFVIRCYVCRVVGVVYNKSGLCSRGLLHIFRQSVVDGYILPFGF